MLYISMRYEPGATAGKQMGPVVSRAHACGCGCGLRGFRCGCGFGLLNGCRVQVNDGGRFGCPFGICVHPRDMLTNTGPLDRSGHMNEGFVTGRVRVPVVIGGDAHL